MYVICFSFYAKAIDVDHDGIRYEIISINDLTIKVKCFVPGQERESVDIPEYVNYNGKQFKVIEIMDNAFKGTNVNNPMLLKYITLPNTLETIGKYAFQYSNIEEIVIPDAVKTMGDKTFWFCKQLKNAKVGRGLTSLPRGCFCDCESLRYVFIPNSITFIDCYALTECGSIQSLIIEDSDVLLSCSSQGILIKNQEKTYSVFGGTDIENFYIGRNLTDYTNISLDNLPRPENVVVGPKVTSIKGVFGDEILKTIKLTSPNPPTLNNISDEKFMTVNVYVPKGSLNTYKKNSYWKNFWNIIEYDSSCQAPTVEFKDGKLAISPNTPGSICYYNLTSSDVKTNAEATSPVDLSATYEIEAYAMYNNSRSESVFATICWVDGTFSTNGLEFQMPEKRAVLIQMSNGTMQISGLNEDETVEIYSLNGSFVDGASAKCGAVSLDVDSYRGQNIIVKFGNESKIINVK